jgi:hypothetical protein
MPGAQAGSRYIGVGVPAIIRHMLSEWLKIMLEEIARKNAAMEQALFEEQRRAAEPGGRPAPGADQAAG